MTKSNDWCLATRILVGGLTVITIFTFIIALWSHTISFIAIALVILTMYMIVCMIGALVEKLWKSIS